MQKYFEEEFLNTLVLTTIPYEFNDKSNDQEFFRNSIGNVINCLESGYNKIIRTGANTVDLSHKTYDLMLSVHFGDIEIADAFQESVATKYPIIDKRGSDILEEKEIALFIEEEVSYRYDKTISINKEQIVVTDDEGREKIVDSIDIYFIKETKYSLANKIIRDYIAREMFIRFGMFLGKTDKKPRLSDIEYHMYFINEEVI